MLTTHHVFFQEFTKYIDRFEKYEIKYGADDDHYFTLYEYI